MSMLNKLTSLAQSRKGRDAIDRAQRYAKSPEGRARIDKLRGKSGEKRTPKR